MQQAELALSRRSLDHVQSQTSLQTTQHLKCAPRTGEKQTLQLCKLLNMSRNRARAIAESHGTFFFEQRSSEHPSER